MNLGKREHLNKDYLDKNVQNVNDVTYLGIIIDHKLNYKTYVEKIAKQMSFVQRKIILYKKSVDNFLRKQCQVCDDLWSYCLWLYN